MSIPNSDSPFSGSGGWMPRWSPDGSALYYAKPKSIVRVPLILGEGGVAVGEAREIPTAAWSFDVAPDSRILAGEPVEPLERTPVTVVLNWQAVVARQAQ